jgi:hypothetical protein
MSKLNFNYTLTFHTDPPPMAIMNSQSHQVLSSKALQELEEKERERYITRRNADPSGRIFDKIEATTFEIADTFYQLIHTVQRREQVELEKYRDATAVQEEAEDFDSLKSSIAERDALFDQLKKMQETPRNISPPVTMARPTPHDLKDGPEPANHFTQPALRIVELMLKEERFQPIQSELTTIFDLMGLQASRHCEIKQEEEMKIITLEVDLKVSYSRCFPSCAVDESRLTNLVPELLSFSRNERLLTLQFPGPREGPRRVEEEAVCNTKGTRHCQGKARRVEGGRRKDDRVCRRSQRED